MTRDYMNRYDNQQYNPRTSYGYNQPHPPPPPPPPTSGYGREYQYQYNNYSNSPNYYQKETPLTIQKTENIMLDDSITPDTYNYIKVFNNIL